MLSARFLVAENKHVAFRVKKQQLRACVLVLEFLDFGCHLLVVFIAAHVNNNCDALHALVR